MTEAEFTAAADAYFAKHLDSAYWAARTENEKLAALTQAKNDVSAELPALADRESTNALAAMFEQAVFLLRNHASQTGGRVIASQTLGELSQSFQYLGGSAGDLTLAPRALKFIAAAKKITGPVKFVRG